MRIKGIKAIGFDIDRTLFQHPQEWSQQVGKVVVRYAADKLGRKYDDFEDEYLERKKQYESNTLTLRSFGLVGEEIFQKVFEEYPIDNYVNKDVRLVKIIKQLVKCYRLFVITNGTEKQAEKKLRLLGLNIRDFDPRIYCFDHGWVKPEPAPFLAAIEYLQLKPEEIVYVGDRLDIDVEGAKAVGMKTILIGGTSELADASCETVYDVGLMFE